jgi:glycine betaine/choline ABC-type transport system substrate-binding protein
MWASGILGCTKERPITVGSKNFTEQVILGEIVAQHLENRLGRRVDRQLNLGGTLLVHQALLTGISTSILSTRVLRWRPS